jgi:Glycosyl hydrolases family 18
MKGKMRTAGAAAASVLGLLAIPLTGLPRTVAPAMAAPMHRHGAQYAPYFETWTKDSVATIAAKSGARRLTLAFIQSEGKKGAAACTIAWNGSKKQPISAGRYLRQIARLRRSGGNVIPSFGGYSADQGGTEIADSCHSVPAIARAYEQVIRVYHVRELDMDVEARSLTHHAGIIRRSEAIAMAQHWAAEHGFRLRIQFTIGIEPHGLDKYNIGVVRNAVRHGVKVSSVNLMVFDYYLHKETKPLPMGKLAIEAVRNAHGQLMKVFQRWSARRVWHTEGMTMLPGIDDYPKKTEVTYLGDAAAMMRFARAHEMGFLSIWAIQRDNGGCPGTIDSNSCSGIHQARWAFSHLLEHF